MNTPSTYLKISICFIGLLLVSGCQPKKEPIGIAELTQVVKKRELELIEYKYNETVFLYKNDNSKKKIRFIVKFPVTVSVRIDLRMMKVDSTKKEILLPPPVADEPLVYFADERTEIIKVRDGLVLRNGRTKTLETLQNRIRETKERIKENAISLGMLEQAEEEATKFINDLLKSFNLENTYKVVFKDQEESKTLETLLPEDQTDPRNFIEIDAEIE